MLRLKLHRAVCQSDEAEIAWCLRNGFDVNALDSGFTALLCADYTKPRIIERLLSAGARVDVMSRSFVRPIHLAVKARNAESVRMLVEAGCDINVYDWTSTRPIELAVQAGSLPIVRLLVEKGAHVNNDCVLLAARHNHDRIMNYMLDRNLLVIRAKHQGIDVLKAILQMDNTSFLERVIKLGVNVSQDHQPATDADTDPLFLAIRLATLSHFDKILDYATDVNREYRKRNGPLHYAAVCKADGKKVKMLLARGARIDHANYKGMTPLMSAVRVGAVDLVRVFVDYGADISRTSKKGKSVIDLIMKTMPRSLELAKFTVRQDMLKYFAPQLLYGDERARGIDLRAMLRDRQMRECYESYEEELSQLRNTRFYQNVRLIDVLVRDVYRLCNYARNEDLVKAFKLVDETKYPRYGKWMRERFDEAVARNGWMERAAVFLAGVFSTFNSAFKNPLGLLVGNAMRFFTDNDLRRIAGDL